MEDEQKNTLPKSEEQPTSFPGSWGVHLSGSITPRRVLTASVLLLTPSKVNTKAKMQEST